MHIDEKKHQSLYSAKSTAGCLENVNILTRNIYHTSKLDDHKELCLYFYQVLRVYFDQEVMVFLWFLSDPGIWGLIFESGCLFFVETLLM